MKGESNNICLECGAPGAGGYGLLGGVPTTTTSYNKNKQTPTFVVAFRVTNYTLETSNNRTFYIIIIYYLYSSPRNVNSSNESRSTSQSLKHQTGLMASPSVISVAILLRPTQIITFYIPPTATILIVHHPAFKFDESHHPVTALLVSITSIFMMVVVLVRAVEPKPIPLSSLS